MIGENEYLKNKIERKLFFAEIYTGHAQNILAKPSNIIILHKLLN